MSFPKDIQPKICFAAYFLAMPFAPPPPLNGAMFYF
jgi:hypothetical protein